MKGKHFFLTIMLGISFLPRPFAQWPGNFYAFTLEDAAGSTIPPADMHYKMIPIDDTIPGVVLGIKICVGDTIWRFYEGGNHYMGSTQKLRIVKSTEGGVPENMIIEFPPSFSGGKEHYYRNLYIGVLKFRKGIIKVKLPQTGTQWDNLKEMKLCEDGINFTSYFDVGNYQNK